MSELIEINGRRYHIGRLDVMTQFHVARRLAPVMANLAKASGAGTEPGAMLGAIAEAVAQMSDEDANFVINKSLGVVQIEDAGRMFPVSHNGRIAYQDIGLADLMQIVQAVLTENLGDFFPGSRSNTTGADATSPSANSSPSPMVSAS